LDRTSFFLLFIPGIALVTIGVGFVASAFALTQGAFQPATKRGLASLLVVLIILVCLYVAALNLDHVAVTPVRSH